MNFTIKLLLFIILFSSSVFCVEEENNDIYTDIKKVPAKKAALVLGTAKYISKGKQNYFYTYRIRAAVQLWKAKKVNAIVVSGDKSAYYDEVTSMYKDLIKLGVPSKYITRDFHGHRTFDSIVRAKEVFSLDDYIIVSQKFHLNRALYIAHEKGQKAIGFAAKDIKGTKAAQKMIDREALAQVKAFLDIHVLNTKPKVLGKKIKVNYRK
ncbi:MULTISPECIES: SanA/YdcF family protein [Arcobacteraceae]|uniref:Vancomycin resistance protein n=1 Tax=Poseidonibacter parvus TaxID=1850254 RepID=A0A1P8KMW5_9BACT|nr:MULTISPECIES: ElyC/SanA/YdcF family protein [Arcobacteraceae]APW65849.1 vancomycin resistance protein [Poseidonibacter parvus]